MSIFNPLMWVFFAPAVFLFLVCNMFVSQITGNKRCWLVLQVFSIFCRSLVLSFWEYGEQSRVYQDKASNNIITTQDSGITNQPFPQTDKALFCSNWAWSRNPISVSATWLPWNAAICSTFWKDYKNLHDVELCILYNYLSIWNLVLRCIAWTKANLLFPDKLQICKTALTSLRATEQSFCF